MDRGPHRLRRGQEARRGRPGGPGDAARWPARRHRPRRGPDDRPARRPRRAAGRRPHRRPVGQHGQGRGPRLRPRRAHRRAPGCRAGAGRGGRATAGPRAPALPAGRGDDARRRPDGHRGRCARGGLAHLRAARRPDPRRRHRGAAGGPADRRLGPRRRAAHRQGRAHLAPPPDRGPHLRPRQAGHRAPRGALAPAGPPLGGQRGVGDRPLGLRGQRHPRLRPRRWHGPDARRRGLGPGRGTGPRDRGPDRRAVRRRVDGHLHPGGAPGGQRALGHHAAGPGRRAFLRCRRPRGHHPEPGRGGLRLVPRPGPGGDGAPGHAHARVVRPTTSTRETCAWTSAPSRSGRPSSRRPLSSRWSPTGNTCRGSGPALRRCPRDRIWSRESGPA